MVTHGDIESQNGKTKIISDDEVMLLVRSVGKLENIGIFLKHWLAYQHLQLMEEGQLRQDSWTKLYKSV